MDFGKDRLGCAEAREADIVAYLDALGISPTRIRGDSYWYLSPFRGERTASFKVDRKINRYFDFGEWKGGSIDFIVLNSLPLLERAGQAMKGYAGIRLFLDNDRAGRDQTLVAGSLSATYRDEGGLYRDYKDLNDYLRRLPFSDPSRNGSHRPP